jgi:hypothetical protein
MPRAPYQSGLGVQASGCNVLSSTHLAIKHVFKCFALLKNSPTADPVLHGCAAALQVGSYSAWFVRLLMFVSAPVTWPIGRLLDWLLGDEQTVSRAVSGPCSIHDSLPPS